MTMRAAEGPTVEAWRASPVCGSHYEVSADGRVRRLDTGKSLRPWLRKGYQWVCLSVFGVILKRPVHRLVCEAFHGEPSHGEICRHLNGKRADNRSGNLAWGTHKQNSADAVRHGVVPRGVNQHNHKLTPAIVLEARSVYRSGRTYAHIGRVLGFSPDTIADAVTGASWKHIPGCVASRGNSKAGLSQIYREARWKLQRPERERVARLIRDGESVLDVAKEMDVSETTVRRIMREGT